MVGKLLVLASFLIAIGTATISFFDVSTYIIGIIATLSSAEMLHVMLDESNT